MLREWAGFRDMGWGRWIDMTEQFLFGGYPDTTSTSTAEFAKVPGGAQWDADDYGSLITAAGDISDLYVKILQAPGADGHYVFSLVKNDASLLVTTISGNDITGSNTTDSFSVSPGDKIAIKYDPDGTPITSGYITHSFKFTGSVSGETLIMGGTTNNSPATGTEYNGLALNNALWTSTRNDVVQVIPTDGTLKNFRLEADGTIDAGTITFTVQKGSWGNLSDTSLSATITEGTTGSDLVNEVVVNAGDLVCLKCEATDATVRDWFWGLTFISSYKAESIIMGGEFT